MQDASTDCSYRISQEGLPLVLPHMSKQLVRLSPPDFMRLLKERNCALPDDAKRGLSHPIGGNRSDAPAPAAPALDTPAAPEGQPCPGSIHAMPKMVLMVVPDPQAARQQPETS